MNEKKTGHITDVRISDIRTEDPHVTYNDDEIVIIDDLRDAPDLTTAKVAFNVAILCRTGRLQLDVNGLTTTIRAHQIFVCHSNVVLTNIMATPDIECRVLCASDRIVKTILQSQIGIWNHALYHRHVCIFEIEQEQWDGFDLTIHIFHGSSSPFKRDILVCLLRASFLQICEKLMEQAVLPSAPEASSRMDQLFQQFLENIAKRKVKKVSVAEYADELFITPKYLSTICRKASGKSPLEWISEYTLHDVTYYLRNTNLTAKEIADELGFPNSSFFGRYVREHLGVSPLEYRKNGKDGQSGG